jgi:hypothetical protein
MLGAPTRRGSLRGAVRGDSCPPPDALPKVVGSADTPVLFSVCDFVNSTSDLFSARLFSDWLLSNWDFALPLALLTPLTFRLSGLCSIGAVVTFAVRVITGASATRARSGLREPADE